MDKFDGIILDVDGTIWNTTDIVANAWNKAIEENFPQVNRVTAGILKQQFGKTMDVIADNLFVNLNQDEKNVLLEKCCQLEKKYIEENSIDIAYPNVISSIKSLSEITKVFIVSNCQKGYIELVMKKNGIEKYIMDFECFGNNGNSKGENISLIKSRNFLKNPVYVGDTLGDMEACKEADVPFVWASYGFGQVDNFYMKINNFSELLDLFK